MTNAAKLNRNNKAAANTTTATASANTATPAPRSPIAAGNETKAAPAPLPTLTLLPNAAAITAANNLPTIAASDIKLFNIISKGNNKNATFLCINENPCILANMKKATAPRKLQSDEIKLPLYLHNTLTAETLSAAPAHIQALFAPIPAPATAAK